MGMPDRGEPEIRCEWGFRGVTSLAPVSDAVIIVDVLSFSTAVTMAVSRGVTVLPYRWKDASAREFAGKMHAELAGSRSEGGVSLSPASMQHVTPGSRIVLPSPNGSTLSLATGSTPTFAGCLRNAKSVADAAMKCGSRIAVIPAGERWPEDDSLRPALEDLLGAGAIIGYLTGTLSPESRAAREMFYACKNYLGWYLYECLSGQELVERGFSDDIGLCGELNADSCAPFLKDGMYVQSSP